MYGIDSVVWIFQNTWKRHSLSGRAYWSPPTQTSLFSGQPCLLAKDVGGCSARDIWGSVMFSSNPSSDKWWMAFHSSEVHDVFFHFSQIRINSSLEIWPKSWSMVSSPQRSFIPAHWTHLKYESDFVIAFIAIWLLCNKMASLTHGPKIPKLKSQIKR